MDTSTLIGALLRPDSAPRQALLTALSTCTLVACDATLNELHEVLQRPKFDRYAPLPVRLDFFGLISKHAHRMEVDEASMQTACGACRDAKDDKFLSLALACQAEALISSDADLLVLHPWRGVPIMTPAAFLQAIGE